jgi:hypothetical protein
MAGAVRASGVRENVFLGVHAAGDGDAGLHRTQALRWMSQYRPHATCRNLVSGGCHLAPEQPARTPAAHLAVRQQRRHHPRQVRPPVDGRLPARKFFCVQLLWPVKQLVLPRPARWLVRWHAARRRPVSRLEHSLSAWPGESGPRSVSIGGSPVGGFRPAPRGVAARCDSPAPGRDAFAAAPTHSPCVTQR